MFEASMVATVVIGLLVAVIVYMAIHGVPVDVASRLENAAHAKGFEAGKASVNKWWTDLADTGRPGTIVGNDDEFFVFTIAKDE